MALGLLLGGALAAYLLFQVAVQFSGHELRSVGAAYGWAGQEGTLEVTDSVLPGLGDGGQQCLGVFRPAGGGPARTGVSLYPSGSCEEGRTEEARFVAGEDSWLTTTAHDRAYAGAGPGSGVGASVTALVLVNVFCLGLGLAFAQSSLGSGVVLLRRSRRRWRRWRAPSDT
jgi:hypothetical protein